MDFVAAIANACCESRHLARTTPANYWLYVTHVVYLDTSTSPKVDRDAFNALGIETMRIYGRKGEESTSPRYDAKALTQALEAIIGRKDMKGGPNRRNTLVG